MHAMWRSIFFFLFSYRLIFIAIVSRYISLRTKMLFALALIAFWRMIIITDGDCLESKKKKRRTSVKRKKKIKRGKKNNLVEHTDWPWGYLPHSRTEIQLQSLVFFVCVCVYQTYKVAFLSRADPTKKSTHPLHPLFCFFFFFLLVIIISV